MKTSSVSSLSISQAMRYSTMRTQGDLARALKEQDTGKVFDSGLALGARTAQTVTFARDIERLNGIVDSNGLVLARLTATQEALGHIQDAAQEFLGAGWQANWSNATDQRIVSRIALNETTETSVSANNEGMQKLAMAAAAIGDLFDSNLGVAGKKALVDRMVGLVGEAISSLAELQSQTGVVEQRVTAASERMTMQADLFERSIIDTEGVDPYEAASRVKDLLSHIETSYTLTARIQQLSLLRFLG